MLPAASSAESPTQGAAPLSSGLPSEPTSPNQSPSAAPAVTGIGNPAATPTATAPSSSPGFWPDGKRAAVTLSYDDGLDGQLKYAVPALDERGLRATFFLSSFQGVEHGWSLPDLTQPLTARHEAWRSVGQSGHELAGHTVFHPCEENNPGFRPQDYDLARMETELDDSLARLERLGSTPPLSFAYPCFGDIVGVGVAESSYADLVAERFVTARVSSEAIAEPHRIDLLAVPQRYFEQTTASELSAVVDEARGSGGWVVFGFHGIGLEQECDISQFDLASCALNYLTTDEVSHRALLDYLVGLDDVWVAPMRDVAQYVQSQR